MRFSPLSRPFRPLCGVVLALALAAPAGASIREQWNFEGHDPLAGFKLEGVPPEIVPDPQQPGNHVMKLTLPRGGDRSEVRWQHDLTCPEEVWIGFRMLRPDAGQETFVCCMQVGPIKPPGGKWIGHYQIQSVRNTGRWLFRRFNNPATTDQPKPNRSTDLGAIAWGRWSNWVVHVRLRPDRGGVFEAWKDGLKVYSEGEFNAVAGAAVALKWGAYIGMGNSAKADTIVLFDAIKIGDENSNYAEVDPSK